MKPCNEPGCVTCPYILSGHKVKSRGSGAIVPINYSCNCKTKGLIYCIQCLKCLWVEYVGQTGRELQQRFADHRGYVNNKILQKPTGEHFNSAGHSIHDMRITVIEKVFKDSKIFRETRESMFIRDFESEHKGLNKDK